MKSFFENQKSNTFDKKYLTKTQAEDMSLKTSSRNKPFSLASEIKKAINQNQNRSQSSFTNFELKK
jgi:hypothetical protein